MATLFVVGLGPGGASDRTERAEQALKQAELICGYTVYVDLVREQYPDKQVLTTPMTREIERCRAALEAAASGRDVAMVCSGDSGVYGMASPLCQLLQEYPGVQLEIIPGVTAALGGGAVLGAPLALDFAVISLSDQLTPWAVIEKRLRAAAAGDFAICLYNPESRKRPGYLRRACDILLECRNGEIICGLVRNIGRAQQSAQIMTLSKLRDTPADMFTTVFIGNSTTRVIDGRMVTPRGYEQRLGPDLR